MAVSQLPVLMYHMVTDKEAVDYLTIRAADLDRQLQYIQQQGYTTISMQQLVDYQLRQAPLPEKPVLLTFDDGYRDNFTLLYPLLVKYRMKATIFLVASLIPRTGMPDPEKKYMPEDQLRQMDPGIIGFGLHSYDHSNYKEMTAEQIAVDIDKCKVLLQQMNISFTPVLAYTYGAYHKAGAAKEAMIQVLQQKDLCIAFRIGNRINALPLKNPFIVQRIDIRGNESFGRFRRKLKRGGRLLFL